MKTLVRLITHSSDLLIDDTLPLTAEERTRSQYRFQTTSGEDLHLRLPRGTVLKDEDLLTTEQADFVVKVIAKPEAVYTVLTNNSLLLLKAAYHLGNRHIPLEVKANYLRLLPDPVLKKMLESMNLQVREEITVFYPEIGAYVHHHAHDHDHH
jgi:urease accessory protein